MITMILFWSDSTKSCQLDCWKHFQYAKEYLSSGFTAEQSLTKKSRLKKYSLPRSWSTRGHDVSRTCQHRRARGLKNKNCRRCCCVVRSFSRSVPKRCDIFFKRSFAPRNAVGKMFSRRKFLSVATGNFPQLSATAIGRSAAWSPTAGFRRNNQDQNFRHDDVEGSFSCLLRFQFSARATFLTFLKNCQKCDSPPGEPGWKKEQSGSSKGVFYFHPIFINVPDTRLITITYIVRWHRYTGN